MEENWRKIIRFCLWNTREQGEHYVETAAAAAVERVEERRRTNKNRHYPTILLIFYSFQSPVQEAERPLQPIHSQAK